jgi:drug/metabolite transporter superfamily protein YnfA
MEKFGYLGERAGKASVAGLLWFGIPLAPLSSAAYHEVAKHHGYFYIQHWEWYEWLGIAAPLLLLWWFGRITHDRQWGNIERVSRAFVAYGLIYVVMALVFDLPARLETLARLQPLRSLHLLYIVLFVMMGGFLAEYVLKDRVWRWLLLFVPLSIGMFLAQRSIFPASAQIEWPGASPRNPWAQSFIWIRQNTPVDAVFALDPDYMNIAGEDEIGFRCLAQRSRLADRVKDDGVVSMFPHLAQEWWDQVRAATPWKNFTLENFTQLKKTYGVSWVVLQQPGVAGLDCPHQNGAVQVCRIP